MLNQSQGHGNVPENKHGDLLEDQPVANSGRLNTPDQGEFEECPFMVTRMGSAIYHYLLLPEANWSAGYLGLVQSQVESNRLPACLVLSKTEAIYVDPVSLRARYGTLPWGGFKCSGKLHFVHPLPEHIFDPSRLRRFKDFIRMQGSGFLIGDPTKGGRPASAEELRRLQGFNEHGVPNGLAQCPECGDWRGECLDPSPPFSGMLMRAYCLCENNTRCVRCGRPFSDRRVNANHFDPKDGMIWHSPGFMALGHKCADESTGSRSAEGACQS